MAYKTNTAVVGFGIGHFINTTTGASVTTGTPTCGRLIDGVHGACTNAAVYTTSAWEIDLSADDMNGTNIVLTFSLTDCLPISYTLQTVTKLVSDLNDAITAPTAVDNRTEMDSNSTQLIAIVGDTSELQTNQGNWLTATGFATGTELAKVPKSDGTATWNATALASIESECDDALTVYAPATEFKQDIMQGSVATLINDMAKVPKSDGTVSFNNTALAAITTDVWSQVLSVLASGAPSATPSTLVALNYLYEAWKNKRTTTATEDKIFKADGTTGLVKATVSDDGTTYTKTEYVDGS